MVTGARGLEVTLAVACALTSATAVGCKRETPAPPPAPAAVAAAPRVPVPASVWQRPSMTDRWNHARRVQALIDKWFTAVIAGDFQSLRPLYQPSGFRGVREGATATPVLDVAAWLALREKEHRAGRVLDGRTRPDVTPSNIDGDKVWISFGENVNSGRRHEWRRRGLVFQGIAAPRIVSEWESAVEPGWPDDQPLREIAVAARSADCSSSLALDAAPYWIVAAEEPTHAAALARVGALRAAGRQAEVALGAPSGAAPARFMVVTGVAAERAAADAAAARESARVVEPAQLPGVGRGDALRFAGKFVLHDGELVLTAGRTIWLRGRVGFLRRYRLDDDKLVLVSELALGFASGVHDAQFAERDGAPYMKTKSGGWVRIDPDTGEQTPARGEPPPVAGLEAVVGGRRFTVDRARPGIAIARGCDAGVVHTARLLPDRLRGGGAERPAARHRARRPVSRAGHRSVRGPARAARGGCREAVRRADLVRGTGHRRTIVRARRYDAVDGQPG